MGAWLTAFIVFAVTLAVMFAATLGQLVDALVAGLA